MQPDSSLRKPACQLCPQTAKDGDESTWVKKETKQRPCNTNFQ